MSTDTPEWVPGDPVYENEVDRRWCTHCLTGWIGGPEDCPECGEPAVEACSSCGARDGCPLCATSFETVLQFAVCPHCGEGYPNFHSVNEGTGTLCDECGWSSEDGANATCGECGKP